VTQVVASVEVLLCY